MSGSWRVPVSDVPTTGSTSPGHLGSRAPELDLAPPMALEIDVAPGHWSLAVTHEARAVERPAIGILDLPVEDDMPVQHRLDVRGHPDHVRVGRVRFRRPEFDDEV